MAKIMKSPEPTYRFHIDIGKKCNINCQFCLVGDTRILLKDYKSKNINKIKKGDKIIGFNRENFNIDSVVLNIGKRIADTYEIITENGSVKCTSDHLWLNNYGKWISIDSKIKIGSSRSQIRYFVDIKSNMKETKDYKKGYLRGIFDTDGTYISHNRSQKNLKCKYYVSSIRMKDKEVIEYCKKILEENDVKTNIGKTSGKYKNKKYVLHRLETRSKNNYIKIGKIIEIKDTKEFMRGYVGGMYDADGTLMNKNIVRICQYEEKKKRERLIEYLLKLNIKFVEEKQGIRTNGGIENTIKFISIVNPKIKRKKTINRLQKITNSKIIEIKYIGKRQVYDIQTTTKNFYANGFASHNCYHRHVGDLKKQPWEPVEKMMAEIKAGKDRGNTVMDITGGEPTICEHTVKYVEYAKSLGIDTCIITNGLAGPETVNRLVNAGVTEFLVSIHGTEKTHDLITQMDGSYKKAMKFIERCPVSVRQNTVINAFSQSELDEIASSVPGNVKIVNFINFNPRHQWTHEKYLIGDVIANLKIAEKHLDKAIDILELKGIGVNVRYYPMCRISEEYRRCICNVSHVTQDPYEWDYWIATKTKEKHIEWGIKASPTVEESGMPCSSCSIHACCGGVNKVFHEVSNKKFGEICTAQTGEIIKDHYHYRKEATTI